MSTYRHAHTDWWWLHLVCGNTLQDHTLKKIHGRIFGLRKSFIQNKARSASLPWRWNAFLDSIFARNATRVHKVDNNATNTRLCVSRVRQMPYRKPLLSRVWRQGHTRHKQRLRGLSMQTGKICCTLLPQNARHATDSPLPVLHPTALLQSERSRAGGQSQTHSTWTALKQSGSLQYSEHENTYFMSYAE